MNKFAEELCKRNYYEALLRGNEKKNAVYCYGFPEIKSTILETFRIIYEDCVPMFFYLNNIPVSRVQEVVDKMLINPFTVPSTPKGCADLDEIHIPILENVREIYAKHLKGLEDYPYAYPVHGANEGILHILCWLREAKKVRNVFIPENDYEGFYFRAQHAGLTPVFTKDMDLAPNYFILSNPSAINGNIDNESIEDLLIYGHKLVIDFSYLGSTKKHVYDITHKNIKTVILSMSKPYGMFRYRTGFVFSREPISNLYGNKWFKDDLRLLQVLRVLQQHPPGSLYAKYVKWQKEIVDELSKAYDFEIYPSSSVILANKPIVSKLELPAEIAGILPKFRRGDYYRFCLSPLFEILREEGI